MNNTGKAYYKNKYSILIPTRNGAKYLPYAVKSVLSQPYENCEVIVSLNHSSDNSLEILKQFDDPRLKVIVPPEPLSMASHYEWLLKQATGQWVTVIGDDDAVMPYFFEELESILARWPHVKALSCKRAYYFWQGCYDTHGHKIATVVNYESEAKEKLVNAKLRLLQILSGAKTYSDLPQLYTNGLIHSSVIHRILSKSNAQFYHEPAPDIYSGVAVAVSIKNYLRVEIPLFWVGTSPKSVGMAISMREQGKATTDMLSRASEFEEMSKKNHIGISERIEGNLWRQGVGSVFTLSALHKLPFKVHLFKGKWVEYIVYSSVLEEIKKRYKYNMDDPAKNLEVAYQQQLQKIPLNSQLLTATHLILIYFKYYLKLTQRVLRIFGQRTAITNKNRILSQDHEIFDTIETASKEVARLYTLRNSKRPIE